MTKGLALVTGASRRLGRVFALTLARRGYALALHYRSAEADARETLEAIRAAGGEAFLIQADLREENDIAALFDAIDSRRAPLRVLVNSAATMQRGDAATLSAQAWDETFRLNLRAPFLCAQRAAQRMKPEGGLIVNITDAGASKAWSGYPAYIVSKAALESLTRVLARAFAPEIRVNALAPGLVLPAEDLPPETWERLVRRLPLPRPAKTEELAAALNFLLETPYVTGQTLVIDGGYSLL